jgi:hypothetical protein
LKSPVGRGKEWGKIPEEPAGEEFAETGEDEGGELLLKLPEKALLGDERASNIRGNSVLNGLDGWGIFGIEIDSVGWLRLKKEEALNPEPVS